MSEHISSEQQLVIRISVVLLGLDHRLGLHHPRIMWNKRITCRRDRCLCSQLFCAFLLSLSAQLLQCFLYHADQKALALVIVGLVVSSFSSFILF